MRKKIKITVFISVLFIMTSLSFSMSRTEKEKIINRIKNEYVKIDNNLKNYKTKTVTVKASQASDYFRGGERLVFYTENGEVKKIVNYNNDPGEKRIIEYYIKNKAPYFIKSARADKITAMEKNTESSSDVNTYRYYINPETADILLGIQIDDEKVETEESKDEEGAFDDLLYHILTMYIEIYNLK